MSNIVRAFRTMLEVPPWMILEMSATGMGQPISR